MNFCRFLLGYRTFCSIAFFIYTNSFLALPNRTPDDFGHSLVLSMFLSLSGSSKTSLHFLRDSDKRPNHCWECKEALEPEHLHFMLFIFVISSDTLQHTFFSKFFFFSKGLGGNVFYLSRDPLFFLFFTSLFFPNCF